MGGTVIVAAGVVLASLLLSCIPFGASIDSQKDAPIETVHRSRCVDTRVYKDVRGDTKLPPLLYSFPGSGNTWCRLLIDYATLVYSGSIYSDNSLLPVLPGESECNRRVSVIKAHPNLQTYENITNGRLPRKCNTMKQFKVERIIFLVRNPYKSIWSEFQRRLGGSHTRKANLGATGPQKMKLLARWDRVRMSLAHLYARMIDVEFRAFRQTADCLTIRYEDLTNQSLRIATLDNMASFLNIPSYDKLRGQGRQERLQCAYLLAESPLVHRGAQEGSERTNTMRKNAAKKPRPAAARRKLVDARSVRMTASSGSEGDLGQKISLMKGSGDYDIAELLSDSRSSTYGYTANDEEALMALDTSQSRRSALSIGQNILHRAGSHQSELSLDDIFSERRVCEMWKIFGKQAMQYGYTPYNGFACDV